MHHTRTEHELENGTNIALQRKQQNNHQIPKPKLNIFSATCITNNVELVEEKKDSFSSTTLKKIPLAISEHDCLLDKGEWDRIGREKNRSQQKLG